MPIKTIEVDRFSKKIVIKPKEKAFQEIKSHQIGLVILTDGLKLNHNISQVDVAICGREKALGSLKKKDFSK